MYVRILAYLRGGGWIVAAVATTWVCASSAEKTTEPPLPDGVTVVRDLTYREIDGRRLGLDLYLPVEPSPGPRPAIVAIHGGSWVGGSKREYGPQFARFARHGFVVAVVDYRLARPGAPSWAGALEDVARAVDWLTEHDQAYGVDPDRLTAIGTSAGGLIAAHLARADLSSRGVQAAVCLSTPTSLASLASDRGLKHDPVLDLVGGDPEGSDQRVADASPISHVTPGMRPILLIHGTDDLWVSVNQAREMHDMLDTMEVPNRLIEVVGARHGFELQIEAPTPQDLLLDIIDFLNEVR